MKKIIFIFFTLLIFVIACKSTPKNSTPEDVVIAEEPAPVVAAEEEKTAELYLPENTSIRETDRGRILETNPKIIFKLVETDMPLSAEAAFDQVIEFLDKNTNANIILEAHTSNRGIAYPYNYNLSVVRAKNGKTYLIDKGVASDRVIESPLGEALPEYPTQDALRRYEFVIIENDDDMLKYNTYISQLDVRQESTYQGN
ncbi:OmpA family protein [uncultured Brachyspira sp.]|uniref:OmpA family protein n=1 Tax=uncultured Brachyspira sp. TaxID=221953 RepID=UPI002607D230|nr:OmpA family protein [uncultured Brachyspira sp.]